MAIERPVLCRAVESVIAGSRYEVAAFDVEDVVRGTWPESRYIAVVTTPNAFRARCRQTDPGPTQAPVTLIVGEDELSRERIALIACDNFVMADRIEALLPSLIRLSAYRLSAMPSGQSERPQQVDRRLRMLPQLSDRDRTVLAALAAGSDNGTIAGLLAVSESMAKTYVRRLLTYFGFRNRTDAAVFAAALDLDRPPTATSIARPNAKKW